MDLPRVDIHVEANAADLVGERDLQGVQEIGNTLRKLRKLEREVGAVRFVANDEGDRAWDKLIAWKNAQYRRSNLVEALDKGWVAGTLAMVRKEKREAFSGLLSSLYAGEDLLAVHFGMRSRAIWHYTGFRLTTLRSRGTLRGSSCSSRWSSMVRL